MFSIFSPNIKFLSCAPCILIREGRINNNRNNISYTVYLSIISAIENKAWNRELEILWVGRGNWWPHWKKIFVQKLQVYEGVNNEYGRKGPAAASHQGKPVSWVSENVSKNRSERQLPDRSPLEGFAVILCETGSPWRSLSTGVTWYCSYFKSFTWAAYVKNKIELEKFLRSVLQSSRQETDGDSKRRR